MQAQTIEWIKIASNFISWPLVCLVALFLFHKPLERILNSVVTFKAGPLEVERRKRQKGRKTRKQR